MRALGLLLIASLFVFTLACSDIEPEPPIVPTTISTSIPTQTPGMSTADAAVAPSPVATEAHIDATPTARVEETGEAVPTPAPTSISNVDRYCRAMHGAWDELNPIVDEMELSLMELGLDEIVDQSEDDSEARKKIQAFHRDYSDDLAPIVDSLRGLRPPEAAQRLTLRIIDQLDELSETTLVIDAMFLGNEVRHRIRQSRVLADLCYSS